MRSFLFFALIRCNALISNSYCRSNFRFRNSLQTIFSQPILKSYYECRSDWYVNRTNTVSSLTSFESYGTTIGDPADPVNNIPAYNISVSLPNYLFTHASTYFDSVTAIKQNIRKGLIRVNGVKANNQYLLKSNDYIQHMVRSHVDIDGSSRDSVGSSNSINQTVTTHHDQSYDKPVISAATGSTESTMECKVLWEDQYLAIVFKPQGLPMFNQVSVNDNKVHSVNNSNNNTHIEISNSASNDENDDDNDFSHGNSGDIPSLPTSSSSSSVHASILTALLQSSYRLPTTFTTFSSSASAVDYQPLRRPRLVHRLDQGTGGLVVVAKTHPALSALSHLFASRRIHKTYRAIVVGSMNNTADTLVTSSTSFHNVVDNNPTTLATSANDTANNDDNTLMSGQITMPIDGKAAVTDWRVVQQDAYSSLFSTYTENCTIASDQENTDNNNSHTMTSTTTATAAEVNTVITTLELSPHTGRKHQIRRHLDSISHPILGDPDYWFSHGRRQSAQRTALRHSLQLIPYNKLQKIVPICLFATAISFIHPFKSNFTVNVSIPEPLSFTTVREQLKQL